MFYLKIFQHWDRILSPFISPLLNGNGQISLSFFINMLYNGLLAIWLRYNFLGSNKPHMTRDRRSVIHYDTPTLTTKIWTICMRECVIIFDTLSQASDHFCQIWKETTQNCKCYRANMRRCAIHIIAVLRIHDWITLKIQVKVKGYDRRHARLC